MNLKLYAAKKDNQKIDGNVQLVVVDLDRSRRYPLNFVCILPRYLRLVEKRSSNFSKIFGEKSLRVAKNLLVEAKDVEEDQDTQKAIDKKIKAIEHKNGKAVC